MGGFLRHVIEFLETLDRIEVLSEATRPTTTEKSALAVSFYVSLAITYESAYA